MAVRNPISLILQGGPPEVATETAGRTADNPPQNVVIVKHLGCLFESIAKHRGTAPAVSAKSLYWTYDELLAATHGIVHGLITNPKFSPGDRVILLLPNSAEYVAGFYGVLLAQGVVVPIPPRTETGQLQAIIQSTEASVIISDPQTAKLHSSLLSLSPTVLDLSESRPAWKERNDRARLTSLHPRHGFADRGVRAKGIAFPSSTIAHGHSESSRDVTGNELAAIFFTGGSTGQPKGVMLSHRNLISNAQSIQNYLRITPSDRPLCVLPFHHAFGNSVWQSHLLAGSHVVLDGQTSFPETIFEALVRHRCTSLSGVPDLFRLLIERSSVGQTPLPHLRYMAVAGGALPHHLASEMARRVAPAEFYVMYGQTEATARLAYLPPEKLELLSKGCIGQAVPGVKLKIVDENGRPVPCGVVGELCAAGENVMLGYWKDPSATADRIRSGWLHTGDLASCDSAGWFNLHGRNNAFVKIAGFRVQPADLEEFAVRRLAATQAVVVPCDMPDIGTRLVLYIRTDASIPSLSNSEMVLRCRAELPRQMVPEFIRLVDEFPLNSALKIDRPLLQRWAEETKNASSRTLA